MLTPKYRIYNHGISHNHTTHIYLSPALTFLTQLTGLLYGSHISPKYAKHLTPQFSNTGCASSKTFFPWDALPLRCPWPVPKLGTQPFPWLLLTPFLASQAPKTSHSLRKLSNPLIPLLSSQCHVTLTCGFCLFESVFYVAVRDTFLRCNLGLSWPHRKPFPLPWGYSCALLGAARSQQPCVSRVLLPLVLLALCANQREQLSFQISHALSQPQVFQKAVSLLMTLLFPLTQTSFGRPFRGDFLRKASLTPGLPQVSLAYVFYLQVREAPTQVNFKKLLIHITEKFIGPTLSLVKFKDSDGLIKNVSFFMIQFLFLCVQLHFHIISPLWWQGGHGQL